MKISKQLGLEISFYTSVPKIMIICYTVPEIWHVSDIIVIVRFGQFLALLPPAPPPPPLTTPKKKISQKWKKVPGGINILHKCTKNHDHMLYCSWDIVCDRCNYFSFWAIFCPFTPPPPPSPSNSLKNQNFKKMKKTPGDVII